MCSIDGGNIIQSFPGLQANNWQKLNMVLCSGGTKKANGEQSMHSAWIKSYNSDRKVIALELDLVPQINYLFKLPLKLDSIEN